MSSFFRLKTLLVQPQFKHALRNYATQPSNVGAYQRAIQNYPLLAQALQTGALMGFGDLMAQYFVEKKRTDQLNLRRTLQFAAIGLFVVSLAIGKPLGTRSNILYMCTGPRTSLVVRLPREEHQGEDAVDQNGEEGGIRSTVLFTGFPGHFHQCLGSVARRKSHWDPE